MIRNLKALGLALVAAVALTATMASAAHAEAQFTSEIELQQTTLTAEQESVATVKFVLAGQELVCQQVNFDGPLLPDQQATLTPAHTTCKMYGVEAKVTGFAAGECDYLMYAAGGVDLKCAAGKDVKIDVSTCTITIKPQDNLMKTTYKQEAYKPKDDFTVTWNVTNLEYTYEGGMFCEMFSGVKVNTLFKDGKIIGAMTVIGEDIVNKKPVGIGWDAE
ncbi:MAG TPA: hypothetical protein VFM94_10675 [Solirubrobacterales bacterium]|nr:hypothetical protein [Solirubrobacterales bacterium]